MRLQDKISILIIMLIFLSISFSIFFVSRWSLNSVQKRVETNISNISTIVSNSPTIKKGLAEKNASVIQPYVKNILDNIDEIEFITVADMEEIRYAHPNPQRIGERFVGGDGERVVEKGECYISEATGTLGRSIRSFVPVFHEGNQVGFVVAGQLIDDVLKLRYQVLKSLLLFALLGVIIGIIGALLVGSDIKKSLLGLQPEEIVHLYTEKKAMLDSIKEGIIAIDELGKISLVNDSAIKILNIKDPDVLQKYVKDVFPTSRLIEVLKSGISEYDKEQVINDTIILTNRVPIRKGEEIIGAMATFNDRTQVKKLAEEITGVRQIVEALRANTHEFMNKLHVISGLIELNEIQEAKTYILDVTAEQQEVTSLVMNKIKNPTIAGLLLGKFSRAKELGIRMHLDEASFLKKDNKKIHSHMLVTIIGNLIENAMEAIIKDDKYIGEINIRIQEFDSKIEIEISDNGSGINKENLDRIFRRGFSTKDKDGGVGLFLVKETIDNLSGDIYVDSVWTKGTSMLAILPKEESDD